MLTIKFYNFVIILYSLNYINFTKNHFNLFYLFYKFIFQNKFHQIALFYLKQNLNPKFYLILINFYNNILIKKIIKCGRYFSPIKFINMFKLY